MARENFCPFDARLGWFLLAVAILLINADRVMGGDWPQWRGPNRDGWAAADSLSAPSRTNEPKLLWRTNIGGGFSSPVVAGSNLIYLDGRDGKEIAHAINALDGRERWQTSISTLYQDEWGPGPRSTPFIDVDRVYAQSCNGEFRCLSLADGKVIWGTSFQKDFGVVFLGSKAGEGTARRRGNNGSGLIVGDRLFLPVGSTNGASVVCFDKLTGKILWKSGNDEAAYSSLMSATIAGRAEIIALLADGLFGFAQDTGQILWQIRLRTDSKRHAGTPVISGDDVFVNSQTIGWLDIHISGSTSSQTANIAWANKELRINLSSPVLVGHYLYSQGVTKNYVCVDAKDGKQMWAHSGFGDQLSCTIVVGEKLIITTDRGELFVIAADPTGYRELLHCQVSGKSWCYPAYADGKFFVREGLDHGWKLSCFEFAK